MVTQLLVPLGVSFGFTAGGGFHSKANGGWVVGGVPSIRNKPTRLKQGFRGHPCSLTYTQPAAIATGAMALERL